MYGKHISKSISIINHTNIPEGFRSTQVCFKWVAFGHSGQRATWMCQVFARCFVHIIPWKLLVVCRPEKIWPKDGPLEEMRFKVHVCPILEKGKTMENLQLATTGYGIHYINLFIKRVHHQRSYIHVFTDSLPQVFLTTLINISTQCFLGPNAVACYHCLGHSTGIGCFSPCI